MGIGAFVFSLPHFLPKTISIVSSEMEDSLLCLSNSTTNNSSTDNGSNSKYLVIFILGQILHGVGAAPILSLGNQQVN